MADTEIKKMFVEYKGTKTQFAASSYPTTYADKIVFITGSADGQSPCIWARGVYFANFAEMLSAINYVKGVSVDGTSYNAAAGGGYIAFGASNPSTVKVNVGQNGVEIGLTAEFIKLVNDTNTLATNTSTALGAKTDAADKDGSAFARIANLAALVSDLTGGSTDSIEGQITNAINALRTEIVGTLDTNDSKTLQAINDELDALATAISDAKAEVIGQGSDESSKATIYGAKKYADEKASAAETAAKEYADQQVTNSAIAINGVLQTLVGDDTDAEGNVTKSIRTIANEELAKQLIPEGASESLDSLKEIADWIQQHPEDVSAMNTQIGANKDAIAKLNGNDTTAGSVAKAIKDNNDNVVTPALNTKVKNVTAVDASRVVVTTTGDNSDNKAVSIDLAEVVTSNATAGLGLTGNQTPAFGGAVAVRGAKYDAYGRVTGYNEYSVTIPSDVASTSADGLMSKGDKSVLDRLNGSAETTGSVMYQVAQGSATAETNAKSYADGLFAWEVIEA